MSQAPHTEESSHEGPVKTSKQLVAAIAAAFIVPIAVIALLVSYVATDVKDSAGSDAFSPQAVADRIKPVGVVKVKLASANAGPRAGEEVYKAQCTTCHAAGMMGAPKFGDAAAWEPRLGQGLETLLAHALKGFKAMPAQGGGEYNDTEVARGLVYMANQAGGKFTEPAAPAVAASAASAP